MLEFLKRMGSLLKRETGPQRATSLEAPLTPHQKEARRKACPLLELPVELQEHIVALNAEPKDLCALTQSCARLRQLCTEARSGPPLPVAACDQQGWRGAR